MLDYCIYNHLDYVLPSSTRSKCDILRLEYLSACKITENENDLKKTLHHIPPSLYIQVFQSMLYKCYLKLIDSFDFSAPDYYESLKEIYDPLPASLGIMILNWPYEELILRNQIPLLNPPVEIFPNESSELASQKEAICGVENMAEVFNLFCGKLIKCILNSIFECTPANKPCNLRMLDVSGLVQHNDYCASQSNYILEALRNLSINKFGHKIRIYADTQLVVDSFYILKNSIEESLKPDVGISVHFKTISSIFNYNKSLPSDFFTVLALGRCEYIQLKKIRLNQHDANNLCLYLPKLVGLSLHFPNYIESLYFLSKFECLEQLAIYPNGEILNNLINGICNMNKGLKYLDLTHCSLHRKDLEYLAKSIHSDTLLQLDLTYNFMKNDHEAVGLITLCQNLKKIKVLIVDGCSLETWSSHSVFKLVNTFENCDQLEFLSIARNPISYEKTNIILDGLAPKLLLRYLGLNLPQLNNDTRWNNEENGDEYKKYLQTSHECINKFRQLPIYISWMSI